tara:strand:- start:7939 stop:8970 length:1032 start_codon:yes stop_codon:yes gene_type:complete
MIQTINETDINLLEAEFYSKPFAFSYSSLNKLIGVPNVFYQEYVLKRKEDEFKKYLIEGTLIHFLVLENQARFDDHFIVSSENLPSANSIAVVEEVFKIYQDQGIDSLTLSDFETEVDQVLTEINLHQSVNDRAKRIAKIIEPKTEEYFNFLKNKGNKTIIDSALLDKCTRRAEVVKNNKEISELLGLDLEYDSNNHAVYNELKLECKAESDQYTFKGIIDNVVIDVPTKTVRINDFKTTSKALKDFSDSIEHWNYWLQAIVYLKLISNFLEEEVNVNPKDWNIEFRFIVFDKYDQLYPFKVSESTIKRWEQSFKTVLSDVEYHLDFKDFTLPAEYAKGIVEL